MSTIVNPFSTTDPILSRTDGTYVVQYDGNPYHVCSKTEDPYNLFDLAEVDAFAKANPTLVSPDTSRYTMDQKASAGIITLAEYQAYAFDIINAKVQAALSAGFNYNGYQIYCDKTAQANITSEMVSMLTGMSTSFLWILGDGSKLPLPDTASFTAFGTAFNSFVHSKYDNGDAAISAVKNATTVAEVQTAMGMTI